VWPGLPTGQENGGLFWSFQPTRPFWPGPPNLPNWWAKGGQALPLR